MFNDKLKKYRKLNKLTQEELAIKVKTTKGTISNYENGHSEPNIKMLIELSQVLKVSIDDLVGNNVSNIINRKVNDKLKEVFDELKNKYDVE